MGAASASGQATVEPGQTFTGRVTEVSDGDMYDVRRSIGRRSQCISTVSTPSESSQSYGLAATRATRRLMGGENVCVTIEDIGRYGRTVGFVEAGGGDLGAMLINGGYGWHYRQYAPNATEYALLEQQARRVGRGLWSRPNPVPPWEWRNRMSGPEETSVQDRDCSDFET